MITIIHCGSEGTNNFSKILNAKSIQNKIIPMEELKQIDEETSGLIIGGSPLVFTKETKPYLLKKFNFVKSLTIPILGVCFGHQMIGMVYGAEDSTGEMIDKQERITFKNSDILFEGIETNTLFLEHHRDAITLPDDFILLADSETCTNEAMKHREKPMYGVQFHPEHSGEFGEKLLYNFVNLCNL